MSEEKKGGALDNVSLSALRAQKKNADAAVGKKESAPEKETVTEENKAGKGSAVFQWSEDDNKLTEGDNKEMPSVSELKKAKESEDLPPVPAGENGVFEPGSLQEKAAKNFAMKEEEHAKEHGVREKVTDRAVTASGVVIEDSEVPTPENPTADTHVVGPLANNSETSQDVAKTMKELDEMTKIARQRAVAQGGRPQPVNLHVDILMDKTGMRQVEFTDEEREKIRVAKKITITQVEEKTLKSLNIVKPKAIRQKTIISKTFSNRFASFVCAASGYMGKVRGLSSGEVIDMISIDETTKNDADSTMLKCSLIFSCLEECSIGKFKSIDEFVKNTAYIDINVILYGIIRATYPSDEAITMNCANPNCTHDVMVDGRPTKAPNQFEHHYKNTEILLTHLISDKLKNESERIYNARYTLEDAKAAQETAIINQTNRFQLGDDVIVDIYCPTIYEYVNNYAKVVEAARSNFENKAGYGWAITFSVFIKNVLLRDVDESGEEVWNSFEDTLGIIETLHSMDDEMLRAIQQCIVDSVQTYMYTYGFKADTVVCPHCGHAFTDDAPIGIERLLFHQGQRHMING